MYCKQIFIWIFTVYSKHGKGEGMVFLYHFGKYLTEMNKQSPHYNQLTTEVLFGDSTTIMSQIFQFVFVKSTY
jgi:hypothetical protein